MESASPGVTAEARAKNQGSWLLERIKVNRGVLSVKDVNIIFHTPG